MLRSYYKMSLNKVYVYPLKCADTVDLLLLLPFFFLSFFYHLRKIVGNITFLGPDYLIQKDKHETIITQITCIRQADP